MEARSIYLHEILKLYPKTKSANLITTLHLRSRQVFISICIIYISCFHLFISFTTGLIHMEIHRHHRMSKHGSGFNTLGPRQNERHFADDIFKCIFLNENVWIPIKMSLKFVPKGRINNIPTLVLVMAWRRPGGKPLSESMMGSLLTHICVARTQWVKRCLRRRPPLFWYWCQLNKYVLL